MSNNLNGPVLADNQSSKEITINDMVGQLDAALTALLTVGVDDTNVAAISADDLTSHVMFEIGDNGLTAGATITIEAGTLRGLVVIHNVSGQIVTVKVDGQSGAPTVADAAYSLMLVTDVAAIKLV